MRVVFLSHAYVSCLFCASLHIPANHLNLSFLLAALSVFFYPTVHYTHPLHNNKRRLYTDFVLYACWHVHRKHLSGSLFLNISVFKTFRKSLGDGLGKDCWPLTKHCENYIQCNHIACSKERPIFFIREQVFIVGMHCCKWILFQITWITWVWKITEAVSIRLEVFFGGECSRVR